MYVGCGMVLNEKFVRLYALLPPVWGSVRSCNLALLMRYSGNALIFVCSLFVWMYGWNGRMWFGSKQAARTFAFIAACCVSAWTCNLAHLHALCWCPNILQSMSMATVCWCSLADLLNVWNGYRVGPHYTNSASYVCIHCCHPPLWGSVRNCNFALMLRFAIKIYYHQSLNGDDDLRLMTVCWFVWMYGTTLSCWLVLNE